MDGVTGDFIVIGAYTAICVGVGMDAVGVGIGVGVGAGDRAGDWRWALCGLQESSNRWHMRIREVEA